MIDPKDTSTADLVGGIPKRRGRPPTGKAMSGAERMIRARNRAFMVGDLQDVSTSMLYERLAYAHRLGHNLNFEAIVSELRSRLLKSQ